MDKTYKPTRWTRADTLKINFNDLTTTQPIIPYNFKEISKDVFIWDTMPLRDLNGEVISLNGWSIIFTLTADRRPNEIKDKNGKYDINADWASRHGRAYISYWYSRTGKDWIFGGRVMAEGVSPTKAEWAGTPILTDDKGSIDLYYTCMGTDVTIAKVSGKIVTNTTGVTLSGFTSVKSLFKADGTYYQTKAQYSGFNFRDPSPFIDPVSKKLCMVFEGNVAGKRGTHTVTQDDIGLVPPGTAAVPDAAKNRVGCIGLAVAKDLKGDEWELYPPLITAVGVNDQTERPHYVFKDGKYYLFAISHKNTYAAGVTGPDGIYGFVSENLTGPYRPMNGSGLVLGNPSSQPLQTYSHCVMPNGLVTSFIDRVYATNGIDYRIGGTEAPTVKIELKDDRSFLIETLDYGYIPPTRNIIV